ncbi:MAG: diaminopimelate epimerase [Gammaproteobacteria bacterium]|nr:MAG: diaminopimelate epimerase [Gammaproteobacteria bacterium]
MGLAFTKMHGIGNDFVVLDCRERAFALDAATIARLGDRHTGVGFDQLLTIEPARDPSCEFYYGIYNSDGSPSGQCGNGVRCVAAWLKRAGALRAGAVRLQSPSGPVAVELLDAGRVRVDMGVPRFAPAEVPLDLPAAEVYALQVAGSDLRFGAVSMGNPHAVIEVADVASVPLATLGAALSTNAHFPQGCNAGFAQVLDRAHVKLRVYERGAGATLACGTGACAAMVVLRQRGKLDETVAVELPGGTLEISWAGPGHSVWMTGSATFVYEGEIDE